MKTPVSGLGYLSVRSHKLLKAVATAIGCVPELDCKTILLEALHTLTAGRGEIKLGLPWKLPPCSLAFTVLERALCFSQTPGGELSPTFLISYGHCLLKY